MARRKKAKSLLPPKVQIPVMVIGAVILALLAYRAVDKIRKKRASQSPETEIQAAPTPPPQKPSVPISGTPQTPLPSSASVSQRLDIQITEYRALEADLNRTREDLEKKWGSPKVRNKTYRPLSRNPFLEVRKPAAELPAEATGNSKITPPVKIDNSRRDRIAVIHLQATSESAGTFLAIVNGRVLREGDSIEGFRVRKIGNRKITIEDKVGTVLIEMEGIPEL